MRIMKADERVKRRHRTQIPEEIEKNEELKEAIGKSLPKNYRFEVEKTLWRLRQIEASRVALQFPEGLLMYGNALAQILRKFHNKKLRVYILGETTYGACCVDDLSAKALNCELLVHYGHSCLVPNQITTNIKMLYIFVDIEFDVSHLVDSCLLEFQKNKMNQMAIAGTVQFLRSINRAATQLKAALPNNQIHIPQAFPLSSGEVLGCTAPDMSAYDTIVFVADGRFHLEAAMIKNPYARFLRYDPYLKRFSQEKYNRNLMAQRRQAAVEKARTASAVAIVLGTLGRQGSPAILARLQALLQNKVKLLILLASEIHISHFSHLTADGDIQAIIQICCPRLSIDWGHDALRHRNIPLLSPYEAFAAFDSSVDFAPQTNYPMDFYARQGGPWSNYYSPPSPLTSSSS
uniref:2-(3-amino-3-carboxypropyl)histidine synthase subunit 1 n=1 Tax=Aureoumbra lagunensis TaxID=44058 RepID=A0A7S3NK92_9STRA